MTRVPMSDVSEVPRSLWIRALTALPAQELTSLVEELSSQWVKRARTLPQSGLGMLKLCDGALHEPFYLGEFPIAGAEVVLSLPDGRRFEGAAQVMDEDVERAELLAVCDAVLAHRLAGWERLSALLEEGMRIRREEAQVRNAMRAKTHVDFSLLDTRGDDHAGD